MLWNIDGIHFIYFFFFRIKKLRAITTFPKLFVAILTWWVKYSFPTMCYKNISFWYFLQVFYHFFMILCNCCILLEIYIIIIDRIYCCFFLSNLDNLYMIHHHKYDLFHGICNTTINTIKGQNDYLSLLFLSLFDI